MIPVMIREFALNTLGLFMVLTLLAIWVAWTETIFYSLLVAWGTAFYLYHLVDTYTGSALGSPRR